MTSPGRNTTWIAGLLVATVLMAGCSAGTAVPSAGSAGASPVSTAAASPGVTGSATADPSGSMAVISDGFYVSDPVTEAALAAAFKQAGVSDDDSRAFLDGFGGREQFRYHFANGKFELAQSVDGGPFDIGAYGTFTFPDAGTLLTQEATVPCTETYDVTTTGEAFALKTRKVSCSPDRPELVKPADQVLGRVITESSPFKRQP